MERYEVNIDFKIAAPDNFEDSQLEDFLELLLKQGQVSNPNIEKLRRCPFLGMVYENDNLIGIGAIKQVYKRPFDKSGIPELKDKYNFELGYIFLIDKEEYRGKGIGKSLCNKLLKQVENKNIFATTEENDENPMKFILKKIGFSKSGENYTGEETGKQIGLYLRSVSC